MHPKPNQYKCNQHKNTNPSSQTSYHPTMTSNYKKSSNTQIHPPKHLKGSQIPKIASSISNSIPNEYNGNDTNGPITQSMQSAQKHQSIVTNILSSNHDLKLQKSSNTQIHPPKHLKGSQVPKIAFQTQSPMNIM